MDAKEGPPKTIRDLKDAVRRFRRIIRSLLRTTKVSANKRRDRIFQNLLTYIDVQLARMSARKAPPVDLMALVTRDLIEVALWCQFITATKENMQQFDDEVRIDLVDMFKLVDPSDEAYPALEESVKRLGVSGNGVRLKKTAGDRFWFKLCSKMIHPTSWSINVLLSSSKADYWRLEP
jgi:hypothetical protein